MYHDLVDYGEKEESGFRNPWAAVYKISRVQFEQQLKTIAESGVCTGVVHEPAPGVPLYITFDDGGSSSIEAARILEKYGWRGHFFIPTDFIGTPGFMCESELRELRHRGHLIGTHSRSHPTRMAALPPAELAREWSESRDRLESILEEKVTVASVPGGYYSSAVGEAAARAGIRWLFHSEPRNRWGKIGECSLIGRYSVQRTTSAAGVAGLANGTWGPALRQKTMWNLKKILKTINPELYIRVASRLRSSENSRNH